MFKVKLPKFHIIHSGAKKERFVVISKKVYLITTGLNNTN